MPTRFDELFRDENIAEAYELVSEFSFFLADLPQRITIRIHRERDSERFYFRQSHWIRTPGMASHYATSVNHGPTEEDALRQGIQTITIDYASAVQRGQTPDDSWLVANPHF